MLVSIDTPTRPAAGAAKNATFNDVVLLLLNDIRSQQSGMSNRMERVETRLVNLMAANGLDRNGKPAGGAR